LAEEFLKLVFSTLYREEEAERLPSEDAVLRIVPAFQRVLIDRIRGEAVYKAHRDKILALNPPDVVRNRLPPTNSKIVWVGVADQDGPDDWVGMILPAGTCGCYTNEILIEFSSLEESERLRPVVDKLGRILEYEVGHAADATWNVTPGPEIMKQERAQSAGGSASQLLEEILNAAKAINVAVESFARIRESLSTLGLRDELEGAITEQVAIEVLSEGAYPLPVGAQGTTIVRNDTNVNVTLKTGSAAPIPFAGTVLIDIPPGGTAAVQKISANAPELQTQVVKWRSFDPCWPPVPGVLCILPPEWTRDLGAGPGGNAIPISVGWRAEIKISGNPSGGLSLS
jgi:hypothetical protein